MALSKHFQASLLASEPGDATANFLSVVPHRVLDAALMSCAKPLRRVVGRGKSVWQCSACDAAAHTAPAQTGMCCHVSGLVLSVAHDVVAAWRTDASAAVIALVGQLGTQIAAGQSDLLAKLGIIVSTTDDTNAQVAALRDAGLADDGAELEK